MIKCDQTGSTITKYVYGWDVANYIACFLTSHRKPSKCPCRIPIFLDLGMGRWNAYVLVKIWDFSENHYVFQSICSDFGAILFFGCFSPGFLKLKRCF